MRQPQHDTRLVVLQHVAPGGVRAGPGAGRQDGEVSPRLAWSPPVACCGLSTNDVLALLNAAAKDGDHKLEALDDVVVGTARLALAICRPKSARGGCFSLAAAAAGQGTLDLASLVGALRSASEAFRGLLPHAGLNCDSHWSTVGKLAAERRLLGHESGPRAKSVLHALSAARPLTGRWSAERFVSQVSKEVNRLLPDCQVAHDQSAAADEAEEFFCGALEAAVSGGGADGSSLPSHAADNVMHRLDGRGVDEAIVWLDGLLAENEDDPGELLSTLRLECLEPLRGALRRLGSLHDAFDGLAAGLADLTAAADGAAAVAAAQAHHQVAAP